MPKRRPRLSPKRLDITRSADADLTDIIGHIEEEAGAVTAERFAVQLAAHLSRLAHLGHSGVSREWISPGLRLDVFGNYCIYFRLTADATIIVRVLHGARDVTKIQFDKLPDQ